jgi:hypothetical protein
VLPRFTAITQNKQDLDIEPLNIAAIMGERVQLCKKDELQANEDTDHYPTQD